MAAAHSRSSRRRMQQRARTRRAARRTERRRRRRAAVRAEAARPRPTSAADALLQEFADAFTQPTFRRARVLLFAGILTVGRRTIQNLLRIARHLAPGHPSSYHRVFSRRRWSLWPVGRILAGLVLRDLVPEGTVVLAGDDTVDEHRGRTVYGKGCHRDAVRSTHTFTAYRWGHKWVVLSILVPLPFTTRRWALPVLAALYRPKDVDAREGRRHKTCPELMRQLLAVLMHWFPERTFVFGGDGGYGTHDLARFAHRHRDRMTVVSRFHADANLFEAPAKRPPGRPGRPAVRGRKLPAPEAVVRKSKRTRLTVPWYGGGTRRVEVVTGTGHWYRAGHGSGGLVPVRWVFVHDLTGTHRDEYFFTTDDTMTPTEVIACICGRWSLETTFQELRAHLGLETTRVRKADSVLRLAPCLFGLYTVVALLYVSIPARFRRARIEWQGKTVVTFSDALTAVRRWLWEEWVFETPAARAAFHQFDRSTRGVLLYALTPAA